MSILPSASPKIYYETSGAGPAVVFIHSFLCDGSLFSHQVAALKPSHRVLNFDIRGHGRSGPAESPFTIYDLLDDVIKVLDAEGVETAIWVGLSIGGFVALRAAITKPNRVSALVLMDTEAGSQSRFKKLQDRALKWGLKILGPKFVVPGITPVMLGKTTRKTKPLLFDEYRQRFLGMRVRSICHCIDAVMRRDDLSGQLAQIRCPTLVMVGDEDVPLPVQKSQIIAEGIPGAKLIVIAGAGHLSAIEQPQAVSNALMEFLHKLH